MEPELTLVIGNKNLSSWSLRPWVLLKHAGIAFGEQKLALDTPEFYSQIGAISPSKRVPVLYHGDLRIWESLAICEYIAEQFPQAALWPADKRARALARAASSEMHAGFASLRQECSMKVTERHPGFRLSPSTQKDVDRIIELWSECKHAAAVDGPFLFGAFSIADAMFAPVAFRFRTHDIAAPDEARTYVQTLLNLPAMKEWEQGAADEG
jgi:glutathione S-transferase